MITIPMKNKKDIATLPRERQLPAMLDLFKSEIKRALPSHLNPERMARIALTCFRSTPALAKCRPESVFASIIQASQLGLEPGINGQAYLIPYKEECTFVPGWKGLVDLVNRSGKASVWTGAVFEGDEFDYSLGDNPHVTHRPSIEFDEKYITHVYAIGKIKGADIPIIEVWPIKKVLKHRDKFNKVGNRHYSFSNLEMYARKVVLLQVLKYIPSSPELNLSVGLNDAGEIGRQSLTIDDAIDGTWSAPSEHEAPETAPALVEVQQPELRLLPDKNFLTAFHSWSENGLNIEQANERIKPKGLKLTTIQEAVLLGQIKLSTIEAITLGITTEDEVNQAYEAGNIAELEAALTQAGSEE